MIYIYIMGSYKCGAQNVIETFEGGYGFNFCFSQGASWSDDEYGCFEHVFFNIHFPLFHYTRNRDPKYPLVTF